MPHSVCAPKHPGNCAPALKGASTATVSQPLLCYPTSSHCRSTVSASWRCCGWCQTTHLPRTCCARGKCHPSCALSWKACRRCRHQLSSRSLLRQRHSCRWPMLLALRPPRHSCRQVRRILLPPLCSRQTPFVQLPQRPPRCRRLLLARLHQVCSLRRPAALLQSSPRLHHSLRRCQPPSLLPCSRRLCIPQLRPRSLPQHHPRWLSRDWCHSLPCPRLQQCSRQPVCQLRRRPRLRWHQLELLPQHHRPRPHYCHSLACSCRHNQRWSGSD